MRLIVAMRRGRNAYPGVRYGSHWFEFASGVTGTGVTVDVSKGAVIRRESVRLSVATQEE